MVGDLVLHLTDFDCDRFTGTVAEIVQRGGRCLIPVFALGRLLY